MAVDAVPDLGRLLTRALSHAPDREPARALEVARAHRLPLAATAAATGLAGSPAWTDALAEERQVASVRNATLVGVRRALGAMAADVAVDAPAWRPVLGSDVDLLVPAAVRGELVHRLVAAGLLEVGWHAAPDRAVLVRTSGASVVDVVDVEAIGEPSLVRSRAPGTFAGLRPEVATARVARSVAARALVRLRDLADVEITGMDTPHVSSDPSARSGWAALRAAHAWLDRAPMPRPLSLDELGVHRYSRRRPRWPSRPALLDRSRRAVRVTLHGPLAADRAVTLTASLSRAAVDVVPLVDPSLRRHLRAVLRGLREPAVVVVAVTSPTASRRPLVPATLECGDDLPPEELLRAVLRLSSR